MKKIILSTIAMISLMTFSGVVSSQSVQADDTSNTDTESEYTKWDDPEADAEVTDLLQNYVNKDVTITNDAFSILQVKQTYGSGRSFRYIGERQSNVLFKDYENSDLHSKLDAGPWSPSYTVFRLDKNGKRVSSSNLETSNINNGLELVIKYGFNSIREQSVKINVHLDNQTKKSISGTVINNDEITPLIDQAKNGEPSNRSVAPKSGWYTDTIEQNLNNGRYEYRVSTSEWIQGDITLKPNGNINTGINIRNVSPLDMSKQIYTYTVSGKGYAGETLYKHDGGVWDYTLPSGTSWAVTQFARDQNGIAYLMVSNDAYVRYYPEPVK